MRAHITYIVLGAILIGLVLLFAGCVRQEVHMDSKEACTEGNTLMLGGKIYCAEEEVKLKKEVEL